MAGNVSQQDLEEFLQQLLWEMTPETVQRVDQHLAKTRRLLSRVLQNVLDEPIPQQKRRPLLPPSTTLATETVSSQKEGNGTEENFGEI